MRANQIWMDAVVFERSHMADIMEIVEPLGGRVEFIPNYWGKDDPNSLPHLVKNTLEVLLMEVFSNVKVRFIAPQNINYVKFQVLEDQSEEWKNEIDLSILRPEDPLSLQFNLTSW